MVTSYVKIVDVFVSKYVNDTSAGFKLNIYIQMTDIMQQTVTNTSGNLPLKSVLK